MVALNKFKKYFPLKNIKDVLKLCEDILDSSSETESDYNIIFISILLGLVEHKLTQTNENEDSETKNVFQNNESYATVQIFSIIFNDVISLYKSFQLFVKEIGGDKLFKNAGRYINRTHLKLITDEVFSKLSVAKYKENCHNQSIFSFLTDKSLDSFGLAYTILAVAHLLGFKHVYLALSEDHAWLEYENGTEDDTVHCTRQRSTADIAWTGRNENKRCNSIDLGIRERSRLYLSGHSVVCINHIMTVVAAITTINPVKGNSGLATNAYSNRSQNSTSLHSVELTILKRDLLWIAYHKDLLKMYPLAAINLADLERNYPKYTDQTCDNIDYPLILYRDAVDINIRHYDNCHVYPYLSMANYFYHYCNFTRAMKCWRMAAHVISKYNYKSEDWIIYREFFDIATHFIPDIFRSSNKDDNPISKSSDSLYQASISGSNKELKKTFEGKNMNETNVDQRDCICEELKGSIDFLLEFLCFFDFICLWEEGSSVPVLHEVWANKFKEVLVRFHEKTRLSLDSVLAEADILNPDRSVDDVLSLPTITLSQIQKSFKRSIDKYEGRFISPKVRDNNLPKPPLSNDEVKQAKDFWNALVCEDVSLLSRILTSRVLSLDFLTNGDPSTMYNPLDYTETVDYDTLTLGTYSQLKSQREFIDYFATMKTIKRILANGTDYQTKTTDQSDNEKQKSTKMESKVPLKDVLKSQKMREICALVTATGRLNIPAIKLPLTAQSQVSLKRTGLQSVYGSHSHEFSSSSFSRKRCKKE